MSEARVQSWATTIRARLNRDPALDRLRGLAIVCMVVDHVCLVFGGPAEIRWSVGRLAMPLFFLVAGTLAGRLSWRHLQIGALGILLPLWVAWIDAPNVLLLWAIGAVVIWAARRLAVQTWILAAVCLVAAANQVQVYSVTSFNVLGVLGLMFLGASLPRSAFHLGGRLPAWLGAVGRRPILLYVGHLLLLDFLLFTFVGGSPLLEARW